MARTFIDSFESRNIDYLTTGLYLGTDGGITTVSTAGLDMRGNYCLSTVSSSANLYLSTVYEIYFAFRYRIQSSSVYYVIRFYKNGSHTCSLSWDSTMNKFRFIRQGLGYAATGSKTITVGSTHFIQLHMKFLANDDGYMFLKVDGDFDMDCQEYTFSYSNSFDFGKYGYFDNFIMDDSELPEETEIILIKPNGVGAYSDWESSTGGDNYTCVDEVPYNDGADYVASGIVNAIDTYTLESLPHAKEIKCIQAQARGRKESDSPISRFNFVVREGTTNNDSATFLLSNNFESYRKMYLVDPIHSQPWYPPGVNEMEIGVKART